MLIVLRNSSQILGTGTPPRHKNTPWLRSGVFHEYMWLMLHLARPQGSRYSPGKAEACEAWNCVLKKGKSSQRALIQVKYYNLPSDLEYFHVFFYWYAQISAVQYCWLLDVLSVARSWSSSWFNTWPQLCRSRGAGHRKCGNLKGQIITTQKRFTGGHCVKFSIYLFEIYVVWFIWIPCFYFCWGLLL